MKSIEGLKANVRWTSPHEYRKANGEEPKGGHPHSGLSEKEKGQSCTSQNEEDNSGQKPFQWAIDLLKQFEHPGLGITLSPVFEDPCSKGFDSEVEEIDDGMTALSIHEPLTAPNVNENTSQEILNKFNTDPDVGKHSISGLDEVFVIHLPLVFKPGAQCLNDLISPGNKQRTAIPPAYLLLCGALTAISDHPGKNKIRVIFETLVKQKTILKTELATLGESEDGEETVVRTKIPVPLVRNIDRLKLLSEECDMFEISSVVEPGEHVGYRIWIVGSGFSTAWNGLVEKNNKSHVDAIQNRRPAHRETQKFDAPVATRNVLDCLPFEMGRKLTSTLAEQTMLEYCRSIKTPPSSRLEALRPMPYFRHAPGFSQMSFPQTAITNYLLVSGPTSVLTFPSGLNVYEVPGSSIGKNIMEKYLPWCQAWLIAPTVRMMLQKCERMQPAEQGPHGIIPKTESQTIYHDPVVKVENSNGPHFQNISQEKQQFSKKRNESMREMDWEQYANQTQELPMDTAPSSREDRLFVPEADQSMIDRIMMVTHVGAHPADIAALRMAEALEENARLRREKKPERSLEDIRKRIIEEYIQNRKTPNPDTVSIAQRSAFLYAEEKLPEFSWKLNQHKIIDEKFTFGDELRAMLWHALAMRFGNVNRTGLALLTVLSGISCFDRSELPAHVFIVGEAGTSKSFMTKLLGEFSLKIYLPDMDEVFGPVLPLMRVTDQAFTASTPLASTVITFEEFLERYIKVAEDDKDPSSTMWKSALSGGTGNVLSLRFDDDGKRVIDFGPGKKAPSFTLVACSNLSKHNQDGATNQIDPAIANRLLICNVLKPEESPFRSVNVLSEYLRSQPEEEKEQKAYIIEIYRIAQCFQQAIWDLIYAKVLPDYNYENPNSLWVGMREEFVKQRGRDQNPYDDRKLCQYLTQCRTFSIFEALGNVYLAPVSEFYGCTPCVNNIEHLKKVHENAGGIQMNVAVSALGILSCVFDNPVKDSVVNALHELRHKGEWIFASTYQKSEAQRPSHSFSVSSVNGPNGFSGFNASATTTMPSSSTSGRSTAPGFQGLSQEGYRDFVESMKTFEEKDAVLSKNRKFLLQQNAMKLRVVMAESTHGESAEVLRQRDLKAERFRKEADRIRNADHDQLQVMMMNVRDTSSNASYIKNSLVVDAKHVTPNITMEAFCKLIGGIIMKKTGVNLPNATIERIIRSLYVRDAHITFVTPLGDKSTSVNADLHETNIEPIPEAPFVSAVDDVFSPVAKDKIVRVHSALFTDKRAQSHQELLRSVVERLASSSVVQKYLTFSGISKFPQFSDVISVHPKKKQSIHFKPLLDDPSEKWLIGGTGSSSKQMPDITIHNEDPNVIAILRFYEKIFVNHGLPVSSLWNFCLNHTSNRIRTESLLQTQIKPRLPRLKNAPSGQLFQNYPIDYIESRQRSEANVLEARRLFQKGMDAEQVTRQLPCREKGTLITVEKTSFGTTQIFMSNNMNKKTTGMDICPSTKKKPPPSLLQKRIQEQADHLKNVRKKATVPKKDVPQKDDVLSCTPSLSDSSCARVLHETSKRDDAIKFIENMGEHFLGHPSFDTFAEGKKMQTAAGINEMNPPYRKLVSAHGDAPILLPSDKSATVDGVCVVYPDSNKLDKYAPDQLSSFRDNAQKYGVYSESLKQLFADNKVEKPCEAVREKPHKMPSVEEVVQNSKIPVYDPQFDSLCMMHFSDSEWLDRRARLLVFQNHEVTVAKDVTPNTPLSHLCIRSKASPLTEVVEKKVYIPNSSAYRLLTLAMNAARIFGEDGPPIRLFDAPSLAMTARKEWPQKLPPLEVEKLTKDTDSVSSKRPRAAEEDNSNRENKRKDNRTFTH